jgi:uncharacterized membrane protein
MYASRKIRVLLAGESWVSNSTHYKGWDFFSSTVYETGVEYLEKALANSNIEFVHMPGHLAATQFPSTMEELSQYDVVILSDLGANTLLLPPEVWIKGKSFPNRLKLLQEWVGKGGGLAMCGGYYSFAGIYAGAKYYRTAIEEVLPVNIYTFDDRVERPDGPLPQILNASRDHPTVRGIEGPWPYLLGFNELQVKPGAELIATVDGYPLLVVQQVGEGRSLAWASDIGPHWCPEPFVTWDGYGQLWRQSIEWLAGK